VIGPEQSIHGALRKRRTPLVQELEQKAQEWMLRNSGNNEIRVRWLLPGNETD
jgi:hypothetical protein